MNEWRIENGLIVLTLSNGTIYLPKASELFAQRKQQNFDVNGASYSSPSTALGIRFSSISANVQLKAEFETDNVLICLYVIKNGNEYPVSVLSGKFADYIIIDSVWYYLGGDYQRISEILSKTDYNFHGISYTAYIQLKRDLLEASINFVDNVDAQVEEIKETTDKFYTEGLKAKLFKYQDSGCHWMNFMVNHKCGCLLGDEMGLGKTLQIIALFGSQKSKRSNSHFLVVCPVSLLENWKREINKFFPALTVMVHHGSRRTGDYHNLLPYDIVIISYSNAQSDLSLLNMIDWDILVIDEAQAIKNPDAKRTSAIKNIKSRCNIAVTGTPFENHVTDIWSLIDFIIPGLLGRKSQFVSMFEDDIESAIRLEKIITPLMIRRRVKDVADDLPPRVDIPVAIPMTEEEARLYESQRSEVNMDDLKSMRLDKIQRLRMFCSHPMVYDKTLANADPKAISHKYERMCEILEEIFDSGEKTIVFTSFNDMINIIVRDISNRYGIYTNYINGSVSPMERQKIIDIFSEHKGPSVLVLNPKAAGAGLNITAANHVIHYNLEWNPAIEDQASARAYRRGQVKTVFIHRLYYTGTIEEIINDKIQHKRDISETAIIGNIGEGYTQEDLVRALSISPYNS
jgi:SNF2 family DNA or RNA helicase